MREKWGKKVCDVDDDDDDEEVVDGCNRNQAKYIYMVYLSINKDIRSG